MNNFSTELSEKWKKQWPDLLPVGEALRKSTVSWVRFYTLPEGKRYPTNDAENLEVIKRHNALLNALELHENLIMILSVWTEDPTPVNSRTTFSSIVAEYWKTIDETKIDEGETLHSYRHLYAVTVKWPSQSVDDLLLQIADDKIAGVILAPNDLGWLYHPYAGGADVISHESKELESLAESYPEWVGERAV